MMIQLFSVNLSSKAIYENLGIARMRTFFEERGYPTEDTYLFLDMDLDKQSLLINKESKYFGISFIYTYADFIFDFARMLKQLVPGSVIFLGGRSATDAYKIILNECDAIDSVILGHGEYPMYEAVQKLESGISLNDISKNSPYITSKKHIENKKECFTDINRLSLPMRNFHKNGLSCATICTVHGCTGSCTYCAWNSANAKWCGRDMRDVFNEVKSIHINDGINHFFFSDGSFEDPGLLGKKRINEFCDYVSDYGSKLSFRCYIRAESFKNNPDDIKLLKKMRANGFSAVFVGIESMVDEDLKLYNKRSKSSDNMNIINLLKLVDIELFYGFIMMNPYSTLDGLKKNYNFLAEYNCNHLWAYVSLLEVFYNTRIYEITLQDGLLLKDYSYKNPFEYKNKYAETEPYKRFLLDNFNRHNAISRSYWEYYNFLGELYHLRITHCNIFDEFINQIQDINKNIALILKNYFYYLYEKEDILFCIKSIEDFKQQLNNEFNKILSIKFKILKHVII